MIASPATPPTTPPTIAAIGGAVLDVLVEEVVGAYVDGFGDGCGVVVDKSTIAGCGVGVSVGKETIVMLPLAKRVFSRRNVTLANFPREAVVLLRTLSIAVNFNACF